MNRIGERQRARIPHDDDVEGEEDELEEDEIECKDDVMREGIEMELFVNESGSSKEFRAPSDSLSTTFSISIPTSCGPFSYRSGLLK